jgi:parallel beta-helix repeat protein
VSDTTANGYEADGSIGVVYEGCVAETTGVSAGFFTDINTPEVAHIDCISRDGQIGFLTSTGSAPSEYIRCIAERNSTNGFEISNLASGNLIECIATDNTEDGFQLTNCSNLNILGCRAINNVVNGFIDSGGVTMLYANNIALSNGINYVGAAITNVMAPTSATSYWINATA